MTPRVFTVQSAQQKDQPMPDSTNVVTFARPGAIAPQADLSSWLAWAECEYAILGGEMSDSAFDWQAAYQRGLKPEEAAAEAAAA